MRTLYFALPLVLLLPFAGRQSAAPEARTDELRTIVERGNDELTARLVAGDAAGVAAVYSEDAVIYGPRGLAIHGREKILEYWRDLTGVKSWKLDVLSVGGRGETIWQTGRSTLVWTAAGTEKTSTVEYCGIWRRSHEGRWHLAVDSYWPVE